VRACRKFFFHFFLLLDAQTVVLGLSHALDCVESLEKRVRSRFSGRTILFMNAPCAERSCRILSTALCIPEEALVPLQRPAAAESGLFA
jgi:chromosomal replication initiation ATPase DnaA